MLLSNDNLYLKHKLPMKLLSAALLACFCFGAVTSLTAGPADASFRVFKNGHIRYR